MNKNYYKTIVIVSSLILFIISLTQVAIIIKFHEITKIPSINYFLMGSTAILGGGIAEWIIWLANPLSLLSMVLFIVDKKTSLKTSLTALILSISFLSWREIIGAESGSMAKIISFESGYYLWLLSIMTLALGIFSYFLFKKDSTI
ncbi:MAG: hypothetical protein KBC56_05270 [Flavobacterium sp.]|nr:hypothetical protein [Flavobacterium sp.]